MSVDHETLPLSIRDLQRTREPLERATALPQAAFTDPPGARRASGQPRARPRAPRPPPLLPVIAAGTIAWFASA